MQHDLRQKQNRQPFGEGSSQQAGNFLMVREIEETMVKSCLYIAANHSLMGNPIAQAIKSPLETNFKRA
jgi:hypothetical protein